MPLVVRYEPPDQYPYRKRKRYGFWHLTFDFILTLLTGGLWLLWIFIRYLRTNTR